MSLEDLKAKGNEALQKKDFTSAVKFYSEGIELDPSNHVFFSNRSAAYLALNNFQKALEDADQTLKINPDFTRGYLRKAQALFYLNKFEECSAISSKGLEKEPQNTQLVKLLKDSEDELKKKGMIRIF
jgi:tetratricopeptide (TPR) repeat protein